MNTAHLHLPARPAWSWGGGSLALRRAVAVVALAAILVPALVLRLDAATGRAHHLSADEKAYLAVAAGIRQHGVYGNRVLEHPFHWAPGAPALFALADAVSGHPADGVVDRRAARNAQAVVGTLTVLAAFALAALLGGLWAGLAAAAAVAFYPPAIEASSLLVSEPLGALAITAALAAVVWAVRRGGALRSLAAGVALGVACLVRADVLLGALVLVAGVAVVAWRAAGRGPGLRGGRGAAGGNAPCCWRRGPCSRAAARTRSCRSPTAARRPSSSPPTCRGTARSSASSTRCTPSWCAAIRATATCRSSASRRGRS